MVIGGQVSIVTKSTYLYIPIIVNQQVWGFQISMNYCRYTSVQAIHAFGLKRKKNSHINEQEQRNKYINQI